MRTVLRAILPAACAILSLLPFAAHAEARGGGRASPVVLRAIEAREIKQGRSFVGSVEPVRSGEVDAEASGLVEALLVEEGDAVEAGAVLARLRTTTLDIRIRAAEAELTLRQQALRELENGSREEDKQQARARLEEAKAEVANAEWKLGAVATLREQKQISEEELREAQRVLATTKARLRALEAVLALVEAGPRAEKIAQAAASVAVQEAEIARLADERKRHVVTAPFGGVVTAKHTEVGEWLDTGEAVVDIAGLAEVDVVVPVLEDAVAHLKRGMIVNVIIDALPEPHLQGVIHRIVPVADRRSRTIPVKVRLKNVMQGEDALIKAGMFARVALAVGKPRQALLAPKDAVVLGGRSPVVYVYDAGTQTAAPVPVTLGVAVEDMIEVEGPLEAGAQVVVRGNERIFPGSKLRPVEGR